MSAPVSTLTRSGGEPPAEEPPSRMRRWASAASPVERTTKVFWALGIVVLLAYPLGMLAVISVRDEAGGLGLGNYSALLDPALVRATLNSIWIGTGTVVGCLLVGVPLAWLVARTDLPGRRQLRTITILTFATPSFIAALGWILLLGPRAGIINTTLMGWFGWSSPPFDIFSPWGIIFVLSMFLYPLVFLPTASALENLDPQLEQAASGLGAGTVRVLRTVTLPLVTPSILGGSMLVFVTSFVIFGPVAILGGPVNFDTIPTAMLRLLEFPPRIETAAVVSVPVLAVIAVLVVVQRRVLGGRRFTTVGGRHGPRSRVHLGRWRAPALVFVAAVITLSLILPFGVLLLTSFRKALGLPFNADNFTLLDNYRRVFAQGQVTQAFANSLLLSTLAVVFGVVFAFLAAWLVQRQRSRANALVPVSMLAPLAFPGAVIGIALIIGYARPPFGLGGGLLILFIAYASKVLPLSYAYLSAGMSQIGPEPEEASRSLGAGWVRTWRKVSLPLLRPTVLAVALLNFVLVFRELETSIFLFTGSNPTTATVLYQLASESLYQLMGALSMVIIVINLAIVLIATRWLGDHPSSSP